MFNTISHQGNTHQNHDESLLPTHYEGCNQRQITVSVDKDMERLVPLCIAAVNVKWHGCHGRQFWAIPQMVIHRVTS